MGANALNRRLRPKAVIMVLLMMLMLAPLTPITTAVDTNPDNLQAQHIAAVFDPVSETTTITWQNIDTYNGNVPYYHSATYIVHRYTEPITASNIDSAQVIDSVVACQANLYVQYAWCLSSAGGNGGQHPGHSVSYLVDAGTNSTFYYAVTVEWDQDGTTVSHQELDPDVSTLTIGVQEETSPIETPLYFQASYSLADSETTLTWINYHSPLLPNTEPALENTSILIWRSTSEISRSNGGLVYQGLTVATLIANISSDMESYVYTVPPSTNEDAYYAITYFIPNKTGDGEDFVDLRFLSNNALTVPVLEDNRPPSHVSVFNVGTSSESDGTGQTELTWFGVSGESGERYDLYVSGVAFTSIYNTGVTFVASVYENQTLEDSNNPYKYTRQLPIGTLGMAYYCVVTVDAIGLFDASTSGGSCDSIEEDAFSNWQKEPTNVHAEFIGDRTIRVTWTDQLGVEGERYHIYSSNGVPTNPSQFATQTTYHGFVNDNTEVFDIVIGSDIVSETGAVLNWYIYVTSEAQYIHTNGSFEYLGLDQNSAGPVEIDITRPSIPQIVNAESRGDLGIVAMEWGNLQELNESYQIWRHNGDPFVESSITSSDEEGWELVLDDINVGLQSSSTIIRNVPIESGSEQDAYYGITVCDQYNNCNPEIIEGLTGNARLIREDARAPSVVIELVDEDGVPYTSPSLVPGLYTVNIEVSEYLKTTPEIEIFSLDGYNETGGKTVMTQTADNLLNPEKGPEYQYEFRILGTETASDLVIRMTLIDEADNLGVITNTSFKIDAKKPTVTVYSPSPAPSDDDPGSKYLYGGKINLMFSAEDDVQIARLQYRLVTDSSGSRGSGAWADAEGITDVNGDGTSLVSSMEFSAGSFPPGLHAVTVRALDTAGNEETAEVEFIVDNCVNNKLGETICQYEEALKPEAEPEVIKPSMSEPPYVLVWIAVVVNIVIFVVALMIVQISLTGPKKKKSGDDDDDDWMSEFIGTTQDLDMDEITGTSSTQNAKPEPQEESTESEDEDDPFAVNVLQRKTRRKKKVEVEDDDDDDDDDDLSWAGLDDDDDEDDDDDDEEESKPRKRPVRKRPARKAAPTRKRPTRRKKSDD